MRAALAAAERRERRLAVELAAAREAVAGADSVIRLLAGAEAAEVVEP